MKHWLPVMIVLALLLVNAPGTRAQDEITFLAPGIMQEPINQLIKDFEAKTGHKVKATFGGEDSTKQQIIKGEEFDVPALESSGKTPLQDVIASGNVLASSATPIAKIPVGVAVRKGAPKPDISTPEAVKQMLLNAKSIAYPDLAALPASGISVNDAIKKLGLLEQMQPKTKFGRGGPGSMALVANGEAEVGFTFLPGMTNPGIDIVGTLPAEVAPPTVVVGFVSAHAKDPAAAKEFLMYLASAEADQAYIADKMQPGR
jgi:molybdate transport system substrate-binding protein